ncbi:MAG: hypothetical protein QM757_14145 [Paludibaculum sp.]
MPDIESFKKQALDELIELLKIPSISTLPEHEPDMRKAADTVEAALLRAGMTRTEQINRANHPLVYGEWLGAPGKPTLLLYGHYDVQPADPLEEWKSPPFEPDHPRQQHLRPRRHRRQGPDAGSSSRPWNG